MKLTELKKTVEKFSSKARKGKKIKTKKIEKVLGKLKEKEKRLKKNLDQEKSQKAQKDLDLKLKIVRAQIKKSHKLLKDLED